MKYESANNDANATREAGLYAPGISRALGTVDEVYRAADQTREAPVYVLGSPQAHPEVRIGAIFEGRH